MPIKQIISRRGALMIPVGLFFAGAMQGCSTSGSSTATGLLGSLPQWATDIQNIATDVASYVGTLPASIGSAVSGTVAQIGSVAGTIASTLTGPAPAGVTGLVSQFGSLLSGLLSSVGGSGALNGLGTFGTILQTGLQLLPVILSLAGVVLAGAAPLPDPKTIAAARAYLAALAH